MRPGTRDMPDADRRPVGRIVRPDYQLLVAPAGR
jgi:hypothetical protein